MLCAVGLYRGKFDIDTFEEKAVGVSEGTLLFNFVVVLAALGRHQGKINICTLEEKALRVSEGTCF